MHELKSFKKERKALKIRLKAAKAEVKDLQIQLDKLRCNEQHKAVDNLEYWLDKENRKRYSLLSKIKMILSGNKKAV